MNNLKDILKQLTTLALLVVFTASCAKNDFVGPNAKASAAGDPVVLPNGDLQFISDSFERDDIGAENGWRGFVLDGTTPVIGFQSNGAGARIPPAGEFGPAADGSRFLLINGRPNGDSIEQTQVISQSFDLTQYNTVVLTFKYLTIGLNDAGEPTENLKLQVCKGTLNECGANDDALNSNGLLSDKWVTVFTSPSDFSDDNFNGKNHTAGDWQTGVVAIDLTDPNFVGDGSTFVFKFVGTMKDGITPEQCQAQAALHAKTATGGDDIDPWTGKKWDTRKHTWCKGKHYGWYKDHNGNHFGWYKCKNKHHPRECPKPKPPCPTPSPKPTPCSSPSPAPTPTPTPPVCTPSDGTLQDGILIDQVQGRATETPIGDVF